MAVTVHRHAGRSGRGLGLAVLAAATLHAVAWWGWGRQGWTGAQPVVSTAAMHVQWATSGAGGSPSRSSQSFHLAEAKAAGRGTEGSHTAVHTQASQHRDGREPVDAPAQGRVSEAAPQGPDAENSATQGAVPPMGSQWLQGRYAPSETLDQSPRPELGWFLDEDVLTPLLHGSMLVQLWVSAEGRIDRAELLRAEPPGDWALRALRPLMGTPMQPGMRAGHPVAATLVVELVSDNERFR